MIHDFKVRQTVSEEETNAKQNVLVLDSIDDEIKVDLDENINKNISCNENKVFPKENVTARNGEVRKADRRLQKAKNFEC